MMKAIIMFIVLLVAITSLKSFGQKKYGYAVLYLKCGGDDAQRDRLYYSPVIELNILDFDRFTAGMDKAIPKYSVRYYNYAIARWFEVYLYELYHISVNHPARYERNATSIILNNRQSGDCNDQKRMPDVFILTGKHWSNKEMMLLQ